MKYSLIYITTENKKGAKKIGRELVVKKLAACVNIFGSMNSIYWWHGKIEEANEAVLIVKTREELVEKVVKKVKELHSYDCPCIISLPITGGSKEYLEWIRESTKL
jgi:periplasmic divalent cation tolerance protein